MAVDRAEQPFKRIPSLAEIKSILELVEFNAQENPHQVFAIQAVKSKSATAPRLRRVSYLDLLVAIARYSKWLLSSINELAESDAQTGQGGSRKGPIGLIMGNEISLWIHMLSLISLDVPVQ